MFCFCFHCSLLMPVLLDMLWFRVSDAGVLQEDVCAHRQHKPGMGSITVAVPVFVLAPPARGLELAPS